MTAPREVAHPTRRAALTMLGQVGFLIACGSAENTGGDDVAASDTGALTPGDAPSACDATIAQDEGPFFVEERLLRSDLTADTENVNVKNGVPLRLRFQVYRVRGGECSPLEGIHVDVWHADTQGLYSDQCTQNTVGDQSLRGYQITNADGIVEFTSIFPGWYTGRTLHIHVKLREYSGDALLTDFTTQLYIDDAITDEVMSKPPYSARGERSNRNTTDGLFTNVPGLMGTPIRLPADICSQGAAGGFTASGPPPGAISAAPPLSSDSMGPRLLIDTTAAPDGNGYVGSFTFGIEAA